MKKIMNFVMLLCLLNILMAGGLVAFLFATGRLDGAKTRSIVELVKHKGTPPKLQEHIFDMLQPTPTSGPATQAATQSDLAAGGATQPAAASAEERIAFARRAMEQERLALENQAQDLRHRQELLVQLQSDVQASLQKIEDAKKESEPQAATAESKTRAENFQTALSLFDELKTKQVKDIFFDSNDPKLSAAFLTAMDPSRAGKVIGEFKTPAEKAYIEAVLKQIRTDGTKSASGTPAAGQMTAAAPPAPGATPPAPVP